MSIQFGLWRPWGPAIEEREMFEIAQPSSRHVADATFVACRKTVGLGLQALVTHERSKLEIRPTVFGDGCIVTLDGRIDNYDEIRKQLKIPRAEIADSYLIAALFRKLGPDCFSRLIGDWAIALWSPSDQSLYLARDHAGTRTLYYEISQGRALWSTVLETFVSKDKTFKLDEAYASRYLSCRPLRDLTPYQGIRAVPAANYVVINLDGSATHRHWEPTSKERILYSSDREYEEHFTSLVRQSVERRTGPGAPILAELSGGMDSSAIVCISDRILADRGTSQSESLDTISYFDDSEPNWDERHYFSIVETHRRKSGIHLNIAFENRSFEPMETNTDAIPPVPGIDRYAANRQMQLAEVMATKNYRVILSGVGGDEVLGGFPTPLPELSDYLISGRHRLLLNRALSFCMFDRTPILDLLARTLVSTATDYCALLSDRIQTPPWIPPHIRGIASNDRIDATTRVPRLGFCPSSIENGLSWWQLLETLPHLYPSVAPRYEYRYPYLDRDLAEFLYRIPREQLVRPGRRRSLMKRALGGIVPAEILERPRKGSLIRGPLLALQRSEAAIQSIFRGSVSAAVGLIDEKQLKTSITEIAKGTSPRWWPALIKAINLEFWLRTQTGLLKEAPDQRSIWKSLRPHVSAKKIRAGSAVL